MQQQARFQSWEERRRVLVLGEQAERLVVVQALTLWVLDCWERSPCETSFCEQAG